MGSSNPLAQILANLVATPAAPGPWETADAVGNVAYHPSPLQGPFVNDVLAYTGGGLGANPELRPRACAVLGPGSTLRGLATALVPHFTAAAPPAAPTADEI